PCPRLAGRLARLAGAGAEPVRRRPRRPRAGEGAVVMAAQHNRIPARMPSPDAEAVEQALRFLSIIGAEDQVFELRALGIEGERGEHVEAGFYDAAHIGDMAREAVRLTLRARGVYATLNPLRPDILARCANRTKWAKKDLQAGDVHVARRRCLLIDVDP